MYSLVNVGGNWGPETKDNKIYLTQLHDSFLRSAYPVYYEMT